MSIDLTKNTVSIPVYTVTDGSFLKMYCTDCKPSESCQSGTFITSSYDHFCNGCSRDFKELAEEENSKQ
jgi:hypothetical protein